MASFEGEFQTTITADRTVAIPPAWWLALIAGDARGEGETSALCFVEPRQAAMTVTTCDRIDHIRSRLEAIRSNRVRQASEQAIYEQGCVLCLTEDGHLPLPLAVTLPAGATVTLRGLRQSFLIRAAAG